MGQERPGQPSPAYRYRWDAAVVEFAADGSLVGVRRSDRVDTTYATWAVGWPGSVDGVPVDWAPPRVSADPDEIEVTRFSRSRPGLTLSVRHTVGSTWTVRVLVANAGPDALSVSGLRVGLGAPPGAFGWLLGAAREARWAAGPADGGGPWLCGWLRRGELGEIPGQFEMPALSELAAGGGEFDDGAGADLAAADLAGPGLLLAGGESSAWHWEWEWHTSAAAFAQRRPATVPWRQAVLRGEVITLASDPDAALVHTAGATLRTREGRDELEVWADHTVQVERRSAAGVVRFDVAASAPPADLLAGVARGVLQRPPGRGGVIDLDLAEAIVLQRHARIQQDADLEDALDRFTARLLDAQPGGVPPLGVIYLCGEYDRGGDVATVAAATAALSACAPAAGSGLAALRLAVTGALAGPSAGPSAAPVGLNAWPPPPGDAVTALEFALPSAAPSALRARLLAAGLLLGAGLPGRPVRALPLARLAQLVAVFGWLPEDVGGTVVAEWSYSPQELARRGLADLLVRLRDRPPGAAHAWLALSAEVA